MHLYFYLLVDLFTMSANNNETHKEKKCLLLRTTSDLTVDEKLEKAEKIKNILIALSSPGASSPRQNKLKLTSSENAIVSKNIN